MTILLSKNTQTSLKLHIQEALTALIKNDIKSKDSNVNVTEGLFEDFLFNKLKIAQFSALQTFGEAVSLIGNNDPSGVLRIINAFLIGLKSREQSLNLLVQC